VFTENNRILGDNPGLKPGRGKPAPDIYLLAVDAINRNLEHKIKPDECLVFEDSVPGVESGRRAGMRVIWVPHRELKTEYEGREEQVLAGRSGFAKHDGEEMEQLGEVGDGRSHCLDSLADFPYETFGIDVYCDGHNR
jgi:pseudouridine-5'-monophosphatase